MEAHHLHLALSSLITLSFFLTILQLSYCTDNARFVECRGNRSELCGFQEFKLTCRDTEYPIIRIEELEFLVLNINQSHYIMTIARLDLWNSPCPPNFVNTTLDFNNFKYYTPTDQNLILFYGCP
ncbi:leaf rust 10 disease-resistance locus receptor-like protein kinase-like 1.4 [Quercus suber]|uniref:Leaf rust 10 disease-resistance locus receptor-like protein kinase-like 1.4 n=1 Tax=Quercus suber TaxID=58331 RepID=A0AAW0L190_QUESU